MMSWKECIIGFLIMLLLPTLVLLGFSLYTVVVNSVPQEGLLECRVQPQVVFPHQDAKYIVTFRGDTIQQQTASPLDFILIVDVSGSVERYINDLAEAARKSVDFLSKYGKGITRFSLVYFSDDAQIRVPWTQDPIEMYRGIQSSGPWGETNGMAALNMIAELMATARSNAKPVAIFFTDGEFDGSHSQIVQTAHDLQNRGLDIYSVGIPNQGSHPLMRQITNDPQKVLDPADVIDLQNKFRYIAENLIPVFGTNASLTHQLDPRYFEPDLSGPNWYRDSYNLIHSNIGIIPCGKIDYELPIVPHASGQWRVGLQPPRLTYIDEQAQIQELIAPRRPAVLVIGYIPLIAGYLPALLWLLYALLRPRPESKIDFIETPPILVQKPELGRIPTLPSPPTPHPMTVPTLFVGIGKDGLRAINGIRSELRHVHLNQSNCPYRFLWIGVDPNTLREPDAFEPWDDSPIQPLTVPASLLDTRPYHPSPGSVPEHLAWFSPREFQDYSAEELNLIESPNPARPLARLALFEWLNRTDRDFVTQLEQNCDCLLNMPSEDRTRQIVLLASPDDSFGSALFLDTGRLFRRIARRRQAQSPDPTFVPEIIGILFAQPNATHFDNRNALLTEIKTALHYGTIPQRINYVSGDELLDAVETESPFTGVFYCNRPYEKPETVIRQGASLAAVLAQRSARNSCLERIADAKLDRMASISVRSLHVASARLQERIRFEILKRFLSQDVLPITREYENVDALSAIRIWASNEPIAVMAQLLDAAIDPGKTDDFIANVNAQGNVSPEWLNEVLARSLTACLRRIEPSEKPEENRWDLRTASTVLRLLLQRLTDSLLPAVRTADIPNQLAITSIETCADRARSIAENIDDWIERFRSIRERLRLRESELKRQDALRRSDTTRFYLGLDEDERYIELETKRILQESFLSTDLVSRSREHLYFAAAAEADSIRIVLRTQFGRPIDLSNIDDVVPLLDGEALARSKHCVGLALNDALHKIDSPDVLSEYAGNLVDTQSSPEFVLLTAPKSEASVPGSKSGLDEFVELIPQIPGQRKPDYKQTPDTTAIRRLELSPIQIEYPSLPLFVEIPEKNAETYRRRLEVEWSVSVPAFPLALRIALAAPDSFLTFCRAYRDGWIERNRDATGEEQWYFSPGGCFLTHGSQAALADAAAGFVSLYPDPVALPDESASVNDFQALTDWRAGGDRLEGDVLTLAVIDSFLRRKDSE